MTSITVSLLSLLMLLIPVVFIIIFLYKNYQNMTCLIEQNNEIIAPLKQVNKERY
ncbi:hypothetical protein ACMGE5_00220 [Macrococcus equi]|uniref:hypothetical protein n=1 Tax=Macrococcus equi TaxID=3395462 RepID=UPI0039BEB51E